MVVQDKELAELHRQLGRHSGNSGQPPSQDGPQAPPRTRSRCRSKGRKGVVSRTMRGRPGARWWQRQSTSLSTTGWTGAMVAARPCCGSGTGGTFDGHGRARTSCLLREPTAGGDRPRSLQHPLAAQPGGDCRVGKGRTAEPPACNGCCSRPGTLPSTGARRPVTRYRQLSTKQWPRLRTPSWSRFWIATSAGRGHHRGHNLWRFRDTCLLIMADPAAPFTNNRAEQTLRMAKLQMRISGCFRIRAGTEHFALMRGMVKTGGLISSFRLLSGCQADTSRSS